jgi:hypothetical protein
MEDCEGDAVARKQLPACEPEARKRVTTRQDHTQLSMFSRRVRAEYNM